VLTLFFFETMILSW